MDDLTVTYGPVAAVREVTLHVEEGETVAVLGPNGAGKSTLLKAIAGAVPTAGGAIRYGGDRIDGLPPEKIVRLGISLIPEGRLLFPALTVSENLQVGAITRRDRKEINEDLERVFTMFAVLGERRRQLAGTLSGGEQQQLAVARALMSRPNFLLVDEPSLGLAPLIVERVFSLIKELRAQGLTFLLVEQNARLALDVSDRAYLLSVGEIVLADQADRLRSATSLEETYLGFGHGRDTRRGVGTEPPQP